MNTEPEVPGILGHGLPVGSQLQHQGVVPLLRQPEAAVGGNAVNLHPVQTAVQIVAALGQPGHIGE